MRTNPRLLAMLGAALLVGGFELAVAASILAPRVSAAYRAHFIDRTSRCWLPGNPVPLAAPETDDLLPQAIDPILACEILPSGWSDREDWGFWSLGPIALMHVPVRPTDRRITLVLVPAGVPQDVRVREAGWEGVVHWDHPGETSIAIPVPDEAARAGWVDISLHPADFRSPAERAGEADRRPIGVGLIRIERSPRDS